MPIFDITRPKDTLLLSVDRKGALPFTVTNVTKDAIRATLTVVPLASADHGIFSIEGGTERNMRPNETLNIRVLVAAPEKTSPGSHKFYLKVVDTDSPDDRFAESQSVEFVVPDNEPDHGKRRFLWWLIPVGVLTLVVAGVTGWYLHTHPKLEDYRRGSVDDAQDDLEAKGMKVNVVMSSIVLRAEEDRKVVEQTIDGKPIVAGTRVKRGTEVSLGYSGAMPSLIGHTLSEAKNVLAQKGFPEPKVITAQSQDPGTWDKVMTQEPDPGPAQKLGSGIIQLWVNVKPDEVPGGMPNVTGKMYCDALSELSRAGLTAMEVLLPLSFTQPNANLIVRAQTPLPGRPILKGADGVTLTHSGGAIRCHRHIDTIVASPFRNPINFGGGQ